MKQHTGTRGTSLAKIESNKMEFIFTKRRYNFRIVEKNGNVRKFFFIWCILSWSHLSLVTPLTCIILEYNRPKILQHQICVTLANSGKGRP